MGLGLRGGFPWIKEISENTIESRQPALSLQKGQVHFLLAEFIIVHYFIFIRVILSSRKSIYKRDVKSI